MRGQRRPRSPPMSTGHAPGTRRPRSCARCAAAAARRRPGADRRRRGGSGPAAYALTSSTSASPTNAASGSASRGRPAVAHVERRVGVRADVRAPRDARQVHGRAVGDARGPSASEGGIAGPLRRADPHGDGDVVEHALSRRAVELRAHRPQLGEELLIDRAREILRAQRAAGAAGERAEHALDELHVVEAPEPELLLVLEQRLGEEEQRRRTRADVERLELDAAACAAARGRAPAASGRASARCTSGGISPCSASTCMKCGSRSPDAASMARNCTLCDPLELPR